MEREGERRQGATLRLAGSMPLGVLVGDATLAARLGRCQALCDVLADEMLG